MATIPNSTTVSAPIAPSDTGDQYPTHFAKYGNGGLMAVANSTAREAIPALRREEGMWVQQLDDGSIWRLLGGIANGNWEEVKITKVVETSGNVISFAVPQVYNSIASPSISNITDDLTGAVIGTVQKIYHNHSVAPTFPVGWVKIGIGNYIPNILNIIYCEWVGGTRVEYWVTQ